MDQSGAEEKIIKIDSSAISVLHLHLRREPFAAIAAKIEKGSPVTPPGAPKNYRDAKDLVTEDCIRPSVAS